MPTMLIVDDEAGIRLMVREMLHDEGYRVLTACDGREALTYLRAVQIDGILCDLMMPGMDGVAFARMVRADSRYAHIPLLLMSAGSIQPAVPAAWLSGFVCKPFTITALLDQVRQALANPPMAASLGLTDGDVAS
jgi:CheY-like chemotaxis protein